MVAVAEHYRPPPESDLEAGVYRVVGQDDDRVTLLRVGDAAERRAVTGEVVSVSHEELAGFDLVREPSSGLAGFVGNVVQGLVWTFKGVFHR
ncbi:hypothetical protein [Haloarchaeobius sp. HME9146]|uniref:hypothetical protein n=1 Tax=Haloarchaeobius sp. HME9146 TaxID=2978732 RepID=UPI0021C19B43|nr:hypothetical protein [Haloarchaeobius sp. HME9146]MCT9096723.1 hypothetical protein [Haloarchaeobius sp. HME9146]